MNEITGSRLLCAGCRASDAETHARDFRRATKQLKLKTKRSKRRLLCLADSTISSKMCIKMMSDTDVPGMKSKYLMTVLEAALWVMVWKMM
ncbi:hypothetical protein WA026_015461 [Henosepilachna vigintioctopunctata]|uniref:Uncharacterized protein n=1 Tax=Henosepilachna vigintioctopunctata TaxID=420089 RepID=A0AAW1UFQ5_9CUCU